MKKNVLVLDNKYKKTFEAQNFEIMTSMDYILDSSFDKNQTVYNLSSSFGYQDIGYYVSLLAMARGDKIYPSPKTIQDLKDRSIQKLYSDELFQIFQSKLKKLSGKTFEISVYFGKNLTAQYDTISWELFRIIQAPLFRAHFEKFDNWELTKLKLLTIEDLNEVHLEFLKNRIKEYFGQSKSIRKTKDTHRYDLAILYNEDEPAGPSDKKALKNFVEAARELDFRADLIQYKDKPNIYEYDALFIRETTNVSHHTYRLARRAEKDGLVVIDDPDSIVKCTNKIFLEQLMSKLKINRPKSFIFNRELMQKNLANITYPCIIKSPDSAFSQGVFKAKTKEEFLHITKKMFEETDLILIQEFLPTDFDWRIGVLNNEVIYACKYYMAEGHWQIIQNQENKDPNYGNFESIDPSKVDDKVLKMALKSTKYIGNGLYGVDLKQKDKDVYMIEVNDNPSIDAGVEDDFLGDELYLKIMRHFLAECNKRRKPHE